MYCTWESIDTDDDDGRRRQRKTHFKSLLLPDRVLCAKNIRRNTQWNARPPAKSKFLVRKPACQAHNHAPNAPILTLVKMITFWISKRGAEISFFPQPMLKILCKTKLFDGTVSVTRNDFLVSSDPHVGILI